MDNEPDKFDPIYSGQLTRNIQAFLQSRGEELQFKRTPEYLTNGAKLLKKTFGSDLGAYMCRQDDTRRFNKWTKGEDLPAAYESVGLVAAIEIVEILLGKLTARRAKEWMTTPSLYLAWELPLDLIREDAELVRRGALQLFL